jgi:hypothetical protein
MADIFISYAKVDRAVTERLAGQLEARGYSVWWDTALVPGDSFREVIQEELKKARAAIVVWTRGAVKSDWVVSEAGRARARGILIPVRHKDVTADDIPQPFEVLHTVVVTDLAAIEAALQKLGVRASPHDGKEAPRRSRRQLWIAAGAAGVLILVAAAAFVYLPRPPAPSPGPISVETPTKPEAIVWKELPAGTYLANMTAAPIATFALPDRASARSADIAPGEVIPPPGGRERLAHAAVKSEDWLRIPAWTNDKVAYVPEKSLTPVPAR